MHDASSQNIDFPAEGRETPEQVVDFLFRAVLRRAPGEAGRLEYARLFRAGRSELELIKLLVGSPEFSAKALVVGNELSLPRMDDYDLESDSELAKYATPEVRKQSKQLQIRTLNISSFDNTVREMSRKHPQEEYLKMHRERFYELGCVVKNVLNDLEEKASILDFGISINSFVMRDLFPAAKISVADRPQIRMPTKSFHKFYPVDLEDDGLAAIDLSDRFDAIVFCEVIEHLRVHPTNVIKFLLRHLSPSGSLLLTTPNLFCRGKLRLISQRKCPLPPYPLSYKKADGPHIHIREYSMKDMLSMIDAAGGHTSAFFFSGCWDDPAIRKSIPAHELANMFFVIRKKS